MKKTAPNHAGFGRHLFFLLPGLLALLVAMLGLPGISQAQTPITPSGLRTQVSDPIVIGPKTQYDITGGTRPGGGTNLFHSFGEFGVPPNNIANFLNGVSFDLNGAPFAAGLPTANILARVTGNIRSDIFGTIRTTDFGNANLFLINPAGFLFGPNATVNVGGMVAFTSTDYLKLTDNKLFTALPSSHDALLSAAPVAAYGFLGSNPGAITVQGSQLTVSQGEGISLVGGNITVQAGTLDDGTVQPARLTAPGGQINLVSVSVASPGEILSSSLQTGPNINGQSFTNMGTISVSQNSLVDVSSDAAGTVRIRGGQLVMDNATISADTVNSDGAPIAIDINVTGNLSVSNDLAPAITARTTGVGNAGEIGLASTKLTVTTASTAGARLAMIDSHTSGTGQAGKVTITTGDIDAAGQVWFIDTGTAGSGNGSDLTITGKNIRLNNMEMNTGDFRAVNQGVFDASGPGGNLKITADSLDLSFHSMTTQSFVGLAGSITLDVGDMNIRSGSFLGTTGLEGSGAVTINANRLIMDNSAQIEAETVFAQGGDITVNAKVVELTTGSTIRTQTSGNADAGNILVTATDHVLLADGFFASRPSGFYSNSLSVPDVPLDTLGGKAGSITVNAPRLEMFGGARVNSATETSGRGGDIIINADSISIEGERSVPIGEDFFNVGLGGTSNSGGIFSGTVGSEFCSGSCGDAGHISLTTGSLAMGNGSMLDTSTSSTGNGGMITITATNAISMSGALSNGDPVGIFSRTIGTVPGSGEGGNIALTAGQSFMISNGASVSASSTGPGNAGNISINAGQQFDMRNSSVKTEAAQASGGNIDIQAVERIRLVNSTISTSVLGGAGGGGNITIDPNVVVLQNSQVIAQAVQGAGGNITITTPLFLADSSSLVSASSQFGLNGTVTIQSPTSNLSGSLGPLTSKPSQAQSLLTQRCAALANGQASSFVVAGREQLPADPGGWLTSPLAFAGIDTEGFGDGTLAEGTSNLEPRTSGLLANDTVSLRRMTPAGFLIANFADSEATGCRS